MKEICILICLLLGFAGSNDQGNQAPISPDTLRCRNELIITGETKVDVLAKCGQPLLREMVGEDRIRTPYGDEIRSIEEWTYNFGTTDFVYVLTFEGGRLIQIRQERRGY